MVQKFDWVKVNSAGPDGIHPILAKKIPLKEDRTKIVKQALESEGLFDTRVALIKKPKKGYRSIQVTNVGARWFEKAMLPFLEEVKPIAQC